MAKKKKMDAGFPDGKCTRADGSLAEYMAQVKAQQAFLDSVVTDNQTEKDLDQCFGLAAQYWMSHNHDDRSKIIMIDTKWLLKLKREIRKEI